MTDDYLVWRERARDALSEARAHLSRTISDYPTPIAGCDAQFNFLLAERRRVAGALAMLDSTPFIPTPRMPGPDREVDRR